MKIVWSSGYHLDIGSHVWPTEKYDRIRERLVADGRVGPDAFVDAEPASWDDLALVHTLEYLGKVRAGALPPDEIRRLEIPASPALTEGFRLMAGGTVSAARLALDEGVAVHLGGGLHHAFPGHGEGFCLFNDVAVAIRRLARDGCIARAAVVDCDVHQGNGTAAIFQGDPTVFTFSIHQQDNYPLHKPASDLDIGLPDGTRDETYLHDLELAMPEVMASKPDLVCYLAGADPFEQDQLGGLRLSIEGLQHRDRLVLEAARPVPVAIVLAGGYARRLADTVTIHANTVLEALARCDSATGLKPGA